MILQTEYVRKDKKNNEVWKLSVANDGPVYVLLMEVIYNNSYMTTMQDIAEA